EWFMWFETLVVTALSIWIWMDSDYFVGASDNLKQNGTFFWALIGPLLISIRYGFAMGVICSLLVIAGIASILNLLGSLEVFSFSLSVGIVLTSMVAGEFRDTWHEKNQKYSLDHDYMRQKLESFTKNYHLLKVSHDQLEHRIAGQQISLRSSVNQLQEIVLKNPDHRFEQLCHPFLHLIADIIGLEVAGIYQMKDGEIQPDSFITLGDDHQLDLKDGMLVDMFETKMLLTPSKLAANEIHKSRYQACIPLLDTSNNLQAIVIAEKTKFFLMTPANIALLALVSNYAADLLNDDLTVPVLEPTQLPLFQQYLQRAKENKRLYGADSCLVVFSNIPVEYKKVLEEIVNYRRGADVYWNSLTEARGAGLVVLLPLTSVWGAQQYVERIKELLTVSLIGAEGKTEINSQLEVFGPLVLHKDSTRIDQLIDELSEDA
ncbi:MAG: PelD GGDEF domain-containing protein, partial [Kangiellaceae bacterium]|nr:PelD GGDEF domain-containing protein [Kangiellaceae bacterium]